MPTLPNFNLTCNVWQWFVHLPIHDVSTYGFIPVVEADYQLPCQLYVAPKTDGAEFLNAINSGDDIVIGEWNQPIIQLRCPALSDIDASIPYPLVGSDGGACDLVEVPAGSGRYYNVIVVEDFHKGFPNEYRVAFLRQWAYTGDRPRT